MVIESNKYNQFSIDLNSYNKIGFHATSLLASGHIEEVGILPNKIFDDSEHKQVIDEAVRIGLDISTYRQWLQMRSISFTKKESDALAHIIQGSSGGQGLGTMLKVLESILLKGNKKQVELAEKLIDQIRKIRVASSIIYAVDLSNLGKRLVEDLIQPNFYQVYFNPNKSLPDVSIVSPDRLIARLDII